MDVCEWVIVQTAFEVDRIEHPDLITVAFEHRAAFGENGALGIGDDVAGMHLHQIGFNKETSLS